MNEELNQYDYIVNAFTKADDNVNLEVNNLNVACITSKNNKFNLDSEGNLTVKTIIAENGNSNQINFDSIYPVGSIYMNVDNTNPSVLFGGTWEQIKDKFLLSCGDSYQNGSIGGAANVSLSIENIPSHNHNFNGTTDGNGNHNHTGNTIEVRSRISSQPTNDTARPITSSADHYGLQITNDAGWHQHSFGGTTGATGGNQAHNNMPPYLAVYVWKRIA